MRRSEVEPYLKKINPNLRIVRHSNRGEHNYHGGSDAVYYYSTFIGAIPPGNLYLNATNSYRSPKYRHRSLVGLINRLKVKGVLYTHKIKEVMNDLSCA